MHKRIALAACLTIAFALNLTSLPLAYAANESAGKIAQAIKTAETSLQARVGVAVYDTATDKGWYHNADERFPMASTFKTLACAALLARGPDLLQQKLEISDKDIQSYAPVTKTLVGQSVSASDLCAITLRTSDNTAANKVLELIGGPSALTAYLRGIGDTSTRLDRTEPDLNESKPGDLRDTTTPRAMMDTMNKLVLGSALDDKARQQLTNWLTANDVGGPLLRAGIPASWRIADRTGAGGFGTRGVVAVIWPPERKPVIAAIYLTETKASMDDRNKAIADIGKALAKQLSP